MVVDMKVSSQCYSPMWSLQNEEHTTPRVTAHEQTNSMLLSALQEAQQAVRSYDTKAQIVGVGYILALNLVLHFGDLLPVRVPMGPTSYAVIWGIIIMPIMLFGHVLCPARSKVDKEFSENGSFNTDDQIFYVHPRRYISTNDFMQNVLTTNWTLVLASELLKASRVRSIKQTRLQRGLTMAVIAFTILGLEQLVRSFGFDI